MEREEGESEDGELIALEKALGSKLGVEVGEEGRVLEEGVDPGGGLGLVEVADLAVAVNLGGRSGTMEKTEEKSLLTVERLQSSEEEGDPFAPLPWLLREALVLLPNYRALMFLLNYIIDIVNIV